MPQWYHQEQEIITPVAPVAPVHTDPTVLPATTAPQNRADSRYDTQTVHRAMEIVEDFPVTHQDMISLAEIEMIVEEAGIEPHLMRKALAVAESEKHLHPQAVKTVKRVTKKRGLTRRAKWLMFGLPLAYFGIAFASVSYISKTADPNLFWSLFFIFGLPLLLTVVGGTLLKRVRQGALVGGLLWASLLAGGSVASPPTDTETWWVFLILILGGAAIGALAGWCGKNFRRGRQLPHWLEDTDESKSSE